MVVSQLIVRSLLRLAGDQYVFAIDFIGKHDRISHAFDFFDPGKSSISASRSSKKLTFTRQRMLAGPLIASAVEISGQPRNTANSLCVARMAVMMKRNALVDLAATHDRAIAKDDAATFQPLDTLLDT